MSHLANDWLNELRHEELLEEQVDDPFANDTMDFEEAEMQAEFFEAEMQPMYDDCEEQELIEAENAKSTYF